MHFYNINNLQNHFECKWEVEGVRSKWKKGPVHKLHKDFSVIEFPPGSVHNLWIYSTLGMSLARKEDNIIELHLFSNKQDDSLVELLTIIASYHRNGEPLGLYHTVNFGIPWQDESKCDHGYISLPYLDGEDLEIYDNGNDHVHNLWLIPITKAERDFKIKEGWEALEEQFEIKNLDYANPDRPSCV
jgi:hypothetical protein